jgi:hypothetical protein
VTIQFKTGLIALALLGSTALGTMTAHAADKEISWIYCGDTILRDEVCAAAFYATGGSGCQDCGCGIRHDEWLCFPHPCSR